MRNLLVLVVASMFLLTSCDKESQLKLEEQVGETIELQGNKWELQTRDGKPIYQDVTVLFYFKSANQGDLIYLENEGTGEIRDAFQYSYVNGKVSIRFTRTDAVIKIQLSDEIGDDYIMVDNFLITGVPVEEEYDDVMFKLKT